MVTQYLGKTVVATKPDGSPVSNTPGGTAAFNKGSVLRSTSTVPPRPTDQLVNGQSKTEAPKDKLSLGVKPYNTIPNPLEQFAHYSVVWTLACPNPRDFNNPTSYRKEGALENIVFSSAGRFDDKRASTIYGKPEFYLNNFIMKTIVAANARSGNSNAIKFEWDIYEPYSMGLLLQALEVAARNAEYINYLDAPYILKMEFKGWNELGQEIKIGESPLVKPKFFVLKLIGVKFNVTESGSQYKMEAIPFNHDGFADTINTVYNDIKLTAGKKGIVEEVLSVGPGSLAASLNQTEKKMVDEKRIKFPDTYRIVFPKSSSDFKPSFSATTIDRAQLDPNNPKKTKNVISGTQVEAIADFDSNLIGLSDFGFDQKQGGNYPFRKHGDQVDKSGVVKRDNMTIDPKNRTFQFSQGQTITAMINQVLLSSTYAKEAVLKKPKDGFINWWRIDVQIELDKYDSTIGDFSRIITYRVVPFKVHHTVFSNASTSPLGYDTLAPKIAKEYNYLYTGQNVDVLKFDIQINNLFFGGLNPKPENESAQAANPNNSGPAEKKNKETKTGQGGAEAAQTSTLGRRRTKRDPELLARVNKGGPGTSDTEKKVAENFHQAFINGSSADLVKVNLEILGDPYWIVDSGMGNYFSPANESNDQITQDGTMNYENGDIFVYLTFRTPADINEVTGLYDFSINGKESPFSGIYRVISCENQFQDGTFKQKLDCLRMIGQSSDFKDAPNIFKNQPKDPENASAIKIGQEEKTKQQVADEARSKSERDE